MVYILPVSRELYLQNKMVTNYSTINCKIFLSDKLFEVSRNSIIIFKIIYNCVEKEIECSYKDLISVLYLSDKLIETIHKILQLVPKYDTTNLNAQRATG